MNRRLVPGDVDEFQTDSSIKVGIMSSRKSLTGCVTFSYSIECKIGKKKCFKSGVNRRLCDSQRPGSENVTAEPAKAYLFTLTVKG